MAAYRVMLSLFALMAFQMVSGLAPDKGDKLPEFPKSFPGCSCKWGEPGWSCTGQIVFPKEVQGNNCCCCSLGCQKAHRCSDEACNTIGVDQKAELDAEKKRIEELLKGADMLISDEVPGFAVDLGQGPCTKSKIKAKCAAKGLTPLCDATSYASSKQCWTPGLKAGKFKNRHFSVWNSHREHFKLGNDAMFYGMCFYASGNGDWALAPYSHSHFWTSGNNALTPWGGGDKNAPRNVNPTASQMNQCKSKKDGGLGCWRTLCVSEKTNR